MALSKNRKVELIKRIPLFARCTRKELEAVAAEADELDVREGKELTRQGERGREVIVLVEGTADVRRNGRRVNRLGAGDFLGEISVISGVPRTATVTTTSDARLLVLTDRAFKRVVDGMPSVQANVLRSVAERLLADTL
jgi:CRP-like cAMP-binding protein